MVLVGIVFLIVGIGLLAVAADHFVDGAVGLASSLNISPVVVGALVIGFGTSLPEMLVSGVAALGGDSDLGVGNVVGSNVANLSLVLGVAAMVAVISAAPLTLRRELPLCAGSVLLFALLVQGGFTRIEGVVLLLAMVGALSYLLLDGRRGEDRAIVDLDEVGDDTTVSRGLLTTIGGLVGTLIGAFLLVEGALDVAEGFNLTGGFVGLTLVAIGTSLPELVTAVIAARKGETELILGNLLGSNIFNSLAVGAVLGLLGPGPLGDPALAGLATVIMIGVLVIAAGFLLSNGRVVRWQAVLLLVVYFATMPFTASTEESAASVASYQAYGLDGMNTAVQDPDQGYGSADAWVGVASLNGAANG